MTELIDITLTLGSDRVVPVPGLVGVCTSPLHTHDVHARSNTKLTMGTQVVWGYFWTCASCTGV